MSDTPAAGLDPLALPLHGSQLIEASAGTGKTFTIALLYVRLVLGHGQPDGSPLAAGLLPPNLLVVTFTEAATQELRERIRARLTQAAEVFSDSAPAPTPDTELLVRLRDQGYPDRSQWPECRRKLLLAAEWMDEAAVATIHGWCHRMLGEHAFDSGSLFRLTLETDQSELLDDVVRDYWRTFFYPLPATLMDEALNHWHTPADLRASLRPLLSEAADWPLPERDVAAALDALVTQRQQQAQALKQQPWTRWREDVAELLNRLHRDKRLHGASRNAMLKTWDALLAWADDAEALLPANLDRAKGFHNQTPAGLADVLKGEGEVPEHPAFDTIAELIAFGQSNASARADILRHAAAWVARRLETEKQQRSEMGFDDLLTRLDAALQGPRGPQLAATLRRQFPVALIDEFQDTDPVQYRIFDRIYRVADNHPDTGLLMIGDPKQAIYAFRGADIYTYLSARRSAGDRTHTLGRNFRSARAMVAAVNRVFAHADQQRPDGAFLFGRGDQSPLPFQPVTAEGTRHQWQVDDQPQPSLTFWTLDPDPDTGRGLAKGRSTEQLAEACAGEITRLLTLGQQGRAGFRPADDGPLQPLQPQDIAVLVNNRGEAAAVREALARRRVKSVYLSDRDSVLRSPEATEILTWLRAFAEPRQLALVRAALATPTLALDWAALDRLLTDELALEREIERFQGYQQQWQTQGVLPVLRSFLMDFDVPSRLLQRPDGERRLTDILHIAELLQQDSLQLDGEHALVHHFTQILRAADEENEHRTLRLESDAGLVKVITVHKSKGLEYPLVFLPFGTAYRAETERRAFVRYHDDQGRLVTVFDPEPEHLARADRERLGEDIRKLYVALTRARHATWVGAAALDGWPRSGLGYLLAGTDTGADTPPITPYLQPLAEAEPAIAVRPVPTPDGDSYQPPGDPGLGPALEAQREAREDWWIASYSALEYQGLSGAGGPFTAEAEDPQSQNLAEEPEIPELSTGPATTQAPQHEFPRGAGPGTFLHEVLEWCARNGFGPLVDNSEPLRDYLHRRCTSRGWEAWAEPLTEWLLALFRTPLPLDRDGHTRMPLAGLTSARPELEFWYESCQVSTSALDRLVRRHTLGGADRPALEQRQLNGMLKGFVDLVFEHQGRYYLLDYKSNHLGEDDSAYTPQALGQTILDKRYDLQYCLYLLALHRLLRARLPDYDYDRHLGGAVYLFLRGYRAPTAGTFTDKPPRELIEQLDGLFDGEPRHQETAV